MSRTYRNRGFGWWADSNPLIDHFAREDEIVWDDVSKVTHHYDYGWHRMQYYTVVYLPHTKSGRYRIARGRMDKVSKCKEPGPSWFRNLYTERPLRRQTKREIQKFMFNPEYEPLIDSKGKLEYWT